LSCRRVLAPAHDTRINRVHMAAGIRTTHSLVPSASRMGRSIDDRSRDEGDARSRRSHPGQPRHPSGGRIRAPECRKARAERDDPPNTPLGYQQRRSSQDATARDVIFDVRASEPLSNVAAATANVNPRLGGMK
jgi:hypothetical protein